jgi:putative hydrolase of the HAD superfamily
MVIVFDLDDTLYDSHTFISSGFRAVAAYLALVLHGSKNELMSELMHEYSVSREEVFDRLLRKKNVYTKRLLLDCVALYRNHDYNIRLYPEAESCLNRLRGISLYVVTDGNKIVQKQKFLALGLSGPIKKCLCTGAYGVTRSKPSPYCFEKICAWERVDPSQVVYVGDNPRKDFVGIKPLGFLTVRVLTGHYSGENVSPQFDAAVTIKNLDELTLDLLRSLGLNKSY